MLRDRIELARVKLHHVLVLDVVGLVDELLEGRIASRGIGVKRRGDAKDLDFLVAHVRVLEFGLQDPPVFDLSKERFVVKAWDDLLDLSDLACSRSSSPAWYSGVLMKISKLLLTTSFGWKTNWET